MCCLTAYSHLSHSLIKKSSSNFSGCLWDLFHLRGLLHSLCLNKALQLLVVSAKNHRGYADLNQTY
jgi:hypothetical protein